MDEILRKIAKKVRDNTFGQKEQSLLIVQLKSIIQKIPAFFYRERTNDDLEDLISEGISIFLLTAKKNDDPTNYPAYLYRGLLNYINKLDRNLANSDFLRFKSVLAEVVTNLENQGKIVSNGNRISGDRLKLTTRATNIDKIFATNDFGEHKTDFSRWTEMNKNLLAETVLVVLNKLDGFISLSELTNKMAVELGFDVGTLFNIAENLNNEDESSFTEPSIILSDNNLRDNIAVEIGEQVSTYITDVIFNFKNEREKKIKPRLWYYYKCEKLSLREISEKFAWRGPTNADYYIRKFEINERYKAFLWEVLEGIEDVPVKQLLRFFENQFCEQLKKAMGELGYE